MRGCGKNSLVGKEWWTAKELRCLFWGIIFLPFLCIGNILSAIIFGKYIHEWRKK